MIHTCDN